MGWMWLWWLLLLLGVIALLVGLVVAAGRPWRHGPTLVARRVLDDRNASGEIADDDYQAQRRKLDEH